MLRPLLLLLSLTTLASCSGKKDFAQIIPGNWIIISPYLDATTYANPESYKPVIDSVERLFCQKLISFNADGSFSEVDSIFRPMGKWIVLDNKTLAIGNGHKGFEMFVSYFKNEEDGVLHMYGKLGSGRDSLPVIWQFKKVENDEDGAGLFTPAMNQWRKLSKAATSYSAIKATVQQMLQYYSAFLLLTSEKSDFFMPARVHLPFRYYAHAITLKSFENSENFAGHFAGMEQAQKAYDIIKAAMKANKEKFPGGDDFPQEYAAYFLQLVKIIGKES